MPTDRPSTVTINLEKQLGDISRIKKSTEKENCRLQSDAFRWEEMPIVSNPIKVIPLSRNKDFLKVFYRGTHLKGRA